MNHFILLILGIYIIYGIGKFYKKIEDHLKLLEGISDDINEIRMKLELGESWRTEPQVKRWISKEVEGFLIADQREIEEIKNYLFPVDETPGWLLLERGKDRKKYDKYIRQLIREFDEARICPQCKKIYYNYGWYPYPDCCCGENVSLITTIEYRQRIKDSKKK